MLHAGVGDFWRTQQIEDPQLGQAGQFAERGVVHSHRGFHVFPDTSAHGLGDQPQHVYSVRFDARELWGAAAEPKQTLYLDLWESYLIAG